MSLVNLPCEIIAKIGTKLDAPSLCRFQQTCKIVNKSLQAGDVFRPTLSKNLRKCIENGKADLVEYGFQHSQRKEQYNYLLTDLVEKGYTDTLRHVLTHTTVPNVKLDVLLHTAVYSKNSDTIRLLVAHGADPNFRRRSNRSNIQIYYNQVAETEAAEPKVFKDFPLNIACEYGDLQTVKTLLELGADASMDSSVALVTACKSGSIETVKAILEAGVRPARLEANDEEDDEETKDPDVYCVFRAAKSTDMLRVLIDAGLEVFTGDLDEDLSEDPRPQFARYFIENRLVPFTIGHRIRLAALEDDLNTMDDYLTRYIAGEFDNWSVNNDCKNAFVDSLELAANQGHMFMMRLILRYKDELPLDLGDVLKGKIMFNLDVARILIDHGADLNHVSADRREDLPVFDFFCRNGNEKVVKFLLDYAGDKLDLNLDKNIERAKKNKHANIVSILEGLARRNKRKLDDSDKASSSKRVLVDLCEA